MKRATDSKMFKPLKSGTFIIPSSSQPRNFNMAAKYSTNLLSNILKKNRKFESFNSRSIPLQIQLNSNFWFQSFTFNSLNQIKYEEKNQRLSFHSAKYSSISSKNLYGTINTSNPQNTCRTIKRWNFSQVPQNEDENKKWQIFKTLPFPQKPISTKTSIPSPWTSQKAVLSAILGNFLISVAKFGAFLATGSQSMLSEAIHSVADTLNQCLLYWGIQRSLKGPTTLHPYGHGPEQYVWGLTSAVGIFFIGAGWTIFSGVSTLFHPHDIQSLNIAFGVLGISFLLEGYTLYVATKTCIEAAKKIEMRFWDYVIRGPDPMGVAVFLEDLAAVIGVGVAAVSLLLTHYQAPFWDSIGTIGIGCILAIVASILIKKNSEALVGRSIPPQQQQKIVSLLKNEPSILNVYEIKAVSLGSRSLKFNAEIDWDGKTISKKYITKNIDLEATLKDLDSKEKLEKFLISYGDGLIDQVGKEVDQIEEKIRKQVPEAQYIDFESH